ncbi:hypothetical protein FN846DRAFT_929078 [Sphaerosporella brunnea]|uniref:RBR-type E3 ubiquitin transferase n=1 Tax=Sphaerosporella brunnea TaxID=1250544 RepID=A0A5J5F9K9_9PEZI|nr:hypothetical protein FN846DRAFT_929078 [Sphaerosporella brunnea]
MGNELDRMSEEFANRLWLEELDRTDPNRQGGGGGRSPGGWPGGAEDWMRLQQAALENFGAVKAKGKAPQQRHNPPPPPRPGGGGGKAQEKGKGKGRATGVNCTACMDEITSAIHKLPCKCAYCTDCLTQLIQTSLKGETGSFPPICCKQPITASIAKDVLSSAEFAVYQERLEDRKSPAQQLYCPNPRCSRRLDPGTTTCPQCRTRLCTACSQREHKGVCTADTELVELAKKQHWKGCPRCGRLVDKEPGTCNHMRCVCGQDFCYLCGTPGTDRCGCPVYTQHDLEEKTRRGFDPWGGLEEGEAEIQGLIEELVVMGPGAGAGAGAGPGPGVGHRFPVVRAVPVRAVPVVGHPGARPPPGGGGFANGPRLGNIARGIGFDDIANGPPGGFDDVARGVGWGGVGWGGGGWGANIPRFGEVARGGFGDFGGLARGGGFGGFADRGGDRFGGGDGRRSPPRWRPRADWTDDERDDYDRRLAEQRAYGFGPGPRRGW